MNGARLAYASCGASLVIGLVGCAGILPQVAAPELPAALQYMFENAGSFSALNDLARDQPPAVVADAAELSGCWGQVAEQVTRDVAGVGDVRVHVFEVYHFDADTGTATYEVYFHDSTGSISMIMTGAGTFRLSEAGRLEIDLSDWTARDARTGQAQNVPANESSSSALLAERGGEYLVLTPESTPDGPTDDSVTFMRLDCP